MSTVPHSEGQSRIFIRCPAKSADVPHFSKMVLLFFSLPIILHVCLATQQSDELRIKIGSKFARRQATDYKYTVLLDQCDRCHLYYTRGNRRQRLFIFSTLPRLPAVSTLLPWYSQPDSNTTPHTVLVLIRSQLTVVNVNWMCI